MKTREEIRMQFFTENNGAYWTNSQEEPDIDYVHWLEDKLISKALTTPVDVENKKLPVYEVVFNEGADDGVTSINLTKTPLLNDFVKTQREQLKAYAKLLQGNYVYHFYDQAVEESIDEFLNIEQTKTT
jgi:hypothetical protein